MKAFWFLWICWRFYRSCGNSGYFCYSKFGVPQLTMFIARDREAFSASEMAVRYFAERMKDPKDLSL